MHIEYVLILSFSTYTQQFFQMAPLLTLRLDKPIMGNYVSACKDVTFMFEELDFQQMSTYVADILSLNQSCSRSAKYCFISVELNFNVEGHLFLILFVIYNTFLTSYFPKCTKNARDILN